MCLTDPCHPAAVCGLDGAGYTCSCPPGTNHTGADLYNASSSLTACQVGLHRSGLTIAGPTARCLHPEWLIDTH